MIHPMPSVTLKAGHVRPVFYGHPWVFAQAVQNIEGGPVAGDEVLVLDPHKNPLGRGLYSPGSAIPVRMFTRDPAVAIDGALFRHRIEKAVLARRMLDLPSTKAGRETNAFRLVHAEGDELPGLIVDLFADVAVVQITTIGMKRREGAVFDALQQIVGPRAILDRTPRGAGKAEGFEVASGVVRGDSSVAELSFVERGFRYRLPFDLSQKTGFYLDQRLLRARVEQLSEGRRVLDAYAFVGTFALAAARGGASSVVAVDESAIALEVAAVVARDNGLADRIELVRRDAKRALSQPDGGAFDLTICDPPKLAPTRGSRAGALGAYRSLAAASCRATKSGGVLVLCSCSSAISTDDLVRALALGAADVRMKALVLERHHQGPDHPVPAAFPEGLYLKSIIARVEARG